MKRLFDWCMFLVAAFVYLFTLIRNQAYNSGNKNDPASKKNNKTYVNPISQCEPHPSESQHRSQEQEYWRWSVRNEQGRNTIAIATLAISVFALIGAGYSAFESRRQANYAFDQQRPWIKITLEPRDLRWLPFSPPSKGFLLNFYPKQTITNVGQSPAINVTVKMSIVSKVPENFEAVHEKSCSDPQIGNYATVFPHDTIDASAVGGGYLGAALEADANTPIPVSVYGCVTYTNYEHRQVYHTTFAFQLWHFIPRTNTPGMMDALFRPNVLIPADELRLIAFSRDNDAS